MTDHYCLRCGKKYATRKEAIMCRKTDKAIEDYERERGAIK